jgi:putative serine protease PepD
MASLGFDDVSPLHPGHPGDGRGPNDDGDGDEDGDDPVEFRPPLPPDDRIWRHPSEVAAAAARPTAPRRRSGGRMVGLVLVSALIGATLSLGIAAALGGFDERTRVVERQVAVQPITDLGNDASSVAAIAARTAPAVAAVRVERDGDAAAGSAIAYRSDGHLLTSGQLVAGASSVHVLLQEGPARVARVVGTDPLTDVAVLHVDGPALDPAAIGTATTLRPGDETVAMGATEDGGWAPAVTTGVVSALDRRMRTADGGLLHDMIVVDAAPDPRAGAALVDAHGAVVGLTSGAPAGTQFGAAIPIDLVRRVADQLIEHGRARHVWLGIEGGDVDPEQARTMGIAGGAAVTLVVDGGPAAAAGLVGGDVVVAVDETAIHSMSDLIAALRPHMPGDVVALSVHRGGEVVVVEVALAERS